MVKKQNISPLLRSDFGIEDFVAGAHRVDDFALSLEDVALSNQLGLLAPLADRADTGTESFAMAAESYLGESNSINILADNVLSGINQRFATAVEISKMGVEGFDAFVYGMEGFTDKIKEFFKIIAAAFKKLILAVSNFIKNVTNFIRGQFAKSQTKVWNENKDDIDKMTDKTKGKLIKVRIPGHAIDEVIKSFLDPIENYNKWASELPQNTTGFAEATIGTTDAGGDEFVAFAGLKTLIFKTKKGNKSITEKTNPTELGRYLVFGDARKSEVHPAEFLTAIGGKAGVQSFLSEDALKKMNAFNKEGQSLIKSFNQILKKLDTISKDIYKDEIEDARNTYNMDAEKKSDRKRSDFKKAKKESVKSAKARRKTLRTISFYRNIGSKLTGTLFTVYSSLLTIRSYCVTAIKAYGANSERQKKKDEKAAERKKIQRKFLVDKK